MRLVTPLKREEGVGRLPFHHQQHLPIIVAAITSRAAGTALGSSQIAIANQDSCDVAKQSAGLSSGDLGSMVAAAANHLKIGA